MQTPLTPRPTPCAVLATRAAHNASGAGSDRVPLAHIDACLCVERARAFCISGVHHRPPHTAQVFPPAWLGEDELWMAFTQCCGNPRPPLNNYNFNVQRVALQRLR